MNRTLFWKKRTPWRSEWNKTQRKQTQPEREKQPGRKHTQRRGGRREEGIPRGAGGSAAGAAQPRALPWAKETTPVTSPCRWEVQSLEIFPAFHAVRIILGFELYFLKGEQEKFSNDILNVLSVKT